MNAQANEIHVYWKENERMGERVTKVNVNGSISCLQFTLTTTKQSIYNTAHKCLKNKYTFSDFNLCHFPIGLKAYSLVTFNVWWCGVDFILYRFSIFSLTLIRCLRCFVSFHSIPLLALSGSNFWFWFRFRFNIIIFIDCWQSHEIF